MECNACHTKNSKDAKYCKNCGSKLALEVNELSKMFNDTMDLVIGIFKKPVDTFKKFINKDNYQNCIIYLASNVVLYSILMLVLVNIFSNTIFTYYFSLDNIFNQSSFSYFRMFLLNIILYSLSYFIFASIYYLVSKYLFKNDVDFKQIISWLGVNSIFLSCLYLLLAITIIVSTKLFVILFIIGLIIFVYNLFTSSKYVFDKDNYNVYIMTISIIITFSLVVFVLPHLFI